MLGSLPPTSVATLLQEPRRPELASFFLGGFESATHRRRDRLRIDVIESTGHGRRAAEDYTLLADVGVRSVRDGLRWHLIEATEGVFDWSSLLPMLHAAHAVGTQVLWDLCHWGVPDWVDPFSEAFPAQFAHFAGRAAATIRQVAEQAAVFAPRFYCPVNEISFWAWVAGDEEHFFPFAKARGPELKRNLARAAIAATRAVREVDPEARFLQAEPIIHITPNPELPENGEAVIRHTAAQYEAWDMISGRSEAALGGSPELLDLVGVNYYWNNQWIDHGDRTPPGHAAHRPLHRMLLDVWQRYGRPILISETGAEGEAAVGWLGSICAEVREAERLGVEIAGICLYPVTDYPGWDDHRHCSCGLIAIDGDWQTRRIHTALAEELRLQQQLFAMRAATAQEGREMSLGGRLHVGQR